MMEIKIDHRDLDPKESASLDDLGNVYPIEQHRRWELPPSTMDLTEEFDLPLPLGEFLRDESLEDYDWVVDGLLERGDRFVMTGGEGDGKSTWFLQFGVKASAGVHPTTDTRMDPIKVLQVDLENGTRHFRREIVKMEGLLKPAQRKRAHRNLYIKNLPEGFDLSLDPDQERLESWCENTKPDLLLIGPRYKMLGNEDDKHEAALTQRFLDHLRTLYGCAIGSESHSPHSSSEDGSRVTREYGTSKWMRWPEFGMHLRRDGEVTHYRSPRDPARPWPARWERNEAGWQSGTGWPWLPMELGVVKISMRVGGADRTDSDREIGLKALSKSDLPVPRSYKDVQNLIAGQLTGPNGFDRAGKVMKWMREEELVVSPGYSLTDKATELLESM